MPRDQPSCVVYRLIACGGSMNKSWLQVKFMHEEKSGRVCIIEPWRKTLIRLKMMRFPVRMRFQMTVAKDFQNMMLQIKGM